MEWHIAADFLHAIVGQKSVEKLAKKLGARFVPILGRHSLNFSGAGGSLDAQSKAPNPPHIFSPDAVTPVHESSGDTGDGSDDGAGDGESSAVADSKRLGLDIAWDQRPFNQIAQTAVVYNYMSLDRSYGKLSAYEVDYPLPSDATGAFSQPPARALVYDFVIPNQLADPALTPDDEDDADVDLGVRTPDADADIRFLEDHAASMSEDPQVFDLKGHHIVALSDVTKADREAFYKGVEELLSTDES